MAILNTLHKPFIQKYGLLTINLNEVPDEEEVVDFTFPAEQFAIIVIFPDEQET